MRLRSVFKWLLTFVCLAESVSASELNADVRQTIEFLIKNELKQSTLSTEQQYHELLWFARASKPYKGMTIHVVSEDIPTHRYESNVLAKAFSQITGIKVIHEITQEDDVVKKMSVQMETDINIYDAYVNDVDFIGTHSRFKKARSLSSLMEGDWQAITLPTLDIEDFIGIDFATGMDGSLYQLPTQQFANLYWYRHDWFSRNDLQIKFRDLYGYELGVPQNWAAYEDIAEFFTHFVKEIDGKRVWGHMDYGKYEPSLGWRISDSWLSLAGVNDIPDLNTPYRSQDLVGDWGIRVKNCHPVGSSVKRGGALDSPAAIYAVEKYVNWLHDFAPPEAKDLTFSTASDYLAKGNVAQQVFWYTAFIPSMYTNKLTDGNGLPLWRVAPSPRGRYWKEGMKSGYQDISGWTILNSTPDNRAAAAWLYAQFVVSKSVSMQKFLAGVTPIRQSDLQSAYLNDNKEKWGGLLEFYQSEARNHWTPTGLSVPDYAALSSAWWQYIGPAVSKDKTVSQSMEALANEMDRRMFVLAKNSDIECSPKIGEKDNTYRHLSDESSPWAARLAEESAVTLTYKEALEVWQK
ncbi:ABC transporter substrate-binding protein [Vibrio sp. HN007]|uniref:ABC transporter substrate-binding protein n=1 Tax=Vibrio iocasae TaxID=3098914 RepID=UPI0035D49327